MPIVQIAVSGIEAGHEIIAPRIPEITAAFTPFGINLVFAKNLVLTTDPEPNGWAALIATLEAQSHGVSPAHLVLTPSPPAADPDYDGLLLDTTNRGVAAVFLGAKLFWVNDRGGPGRQPDLFSQVCIHEIGHLFNLTHDDAAASRQYPSAMSPGTIRQLLPAADAWTRATAEAASDGEPPLVTQMPIYSYPFSARCRYFLRTTNSDPSRLPFHGPFIGGAVGAGADVTRSLSLKVTPHAGRYSVHVGGELYVTLEIENPGAEPVELPVHVGSEFGTLRAILTHEGGTETLHQPSALLCTGERQLLRPGERLHRSFALTGLPGRDFIPLTGKYRCRFELLDNNSDRPCLLCAAEMDIEAVDDPPARKVSQSIVRLAVGRKASVTPQVGLRHEIQAHHNLVRALALTPGRRQQALLAAAVAPGAPVAIRHKAARHIALDRLRRGHDAYAVVSTIRQQFQDIEDQELHDAVRRSAEGLTAIKVRGAML